MSNLENGLMIRDAVTPIHLFQGSYKFPPDISTQFRQKPLEESVCSFMISKSKRSRAELQRWSVTSLSHNLEDQTLANLQVIREHSLDPAAVNFSHFCSLKPLTDTSSEILTWFMILSLIMSLILKSILVHSLSFLPLFVLP